MLFFLSEDSCFNFNCDSSIETSVKQTMSNTLFLENFLNVLYGTMGLRYNASIM